jgi:hypothetical protein
MIDYTVIGEPRFEPAREAAPSPRPVEHAFLTPDELSTLTEAPISALDAFNPTTKTDISNRHLVQLEADATSTKQTPPHLSNRPKTPTFLNSFTRLFTAQKPAPNSEATHPQSHKNSLQAHDALMGVQWLATAFGTAAPRHFAIPPAGGPPRTPLTHP